MNDNGEWLLIKCISEISSDEYNSNSDSLSNNSGQEYGLLEEILNNSKSDKEEDWDGLTGISIGESKLCYSTPMAKNQEFNNVYLNNVDSFNTIFSNSDLYKTAVDYTNINDMDISSSCNNSLIIDECNLYQDFLTARNNSIHFEEDISETDKTLTCVTISHGFPNDCDIAKVITNNDNTVINTSNNISLKNNCTSDISPESKIKNNEIDKEQTEMSICFNRTLLDESGYTEKLLLTQVSDKE